MAHPVPAAGAHSARSVFRRISAACLLPSLILALSGCCSGPVEKGGDQAAFFAPFKEAFAAAGGDPGQQLLQLGLPDKNSIALWYALSPGAPRTGELTVALASDGRDSGRVDPAQIRHFYNSTHRTGRIEVRGLQPGRAYTLHVAGAGLKEQIIPAHTKPATEEAFSFIFGSCFQPYRYGLGRKTAIGQDTLASLSNLQRRTAMRPAGRGGPSLFLALGDQCYVDAGAGIFRNSPVAYLDGGKSHVLHGTLAEAPDYLGQLHRYHLGLPGMNQTLANVPTVMMWDDHDIRDGWGSHGDEDHPGWRTYYGAAREAFVAFQAARNPNFQQIVNGGNWTPALTASEAEADRFNSASAAEELYVQFDWAAATFFIVDGRSGRRFADGRGMHEAQFAALEKWLENDARKGRPTVFVFAYPVPVAGSIGFPFKAGQQVPLPSQDDARDRIFAHERARLLKMFSRHFSENRMHKLLILAGDVHYSGLQTLEETKGGAVLGYEILSSGIAQTEFNTRGPRSGTVSGALSVEKLWLQDQGYYSGPCFAEVFIGPPKGDDPAPQISLLFYPAVLDGRNVELAVDAVNATTAKPIGSYPKNLGDGHYTQSLLRATLQQYWLPAPSP